MATMISLHLLLLLLAALTSATTTTTLTSTSSSSATQSSSSSSCSTGLFILVARGTGEAQGTGAFANISRAIASRVPGSLVQALDYPATFTDPLYSESERDGVQEMHEALLHRRSACPGQKFAVLGYSQGGQVATDAFCGGAGDGFSTLSALPADFVTSSFAAIVLFGDPSHLANATYNRGTSKKDGIFSRENVTYCEDHYNNLMRSFCDTGDRYCDEGDDSDVHGSYFEKYGAVVVDFVVQRYEALEKASAATDSATASATVAATATAKDAETSAISSTQSTATDNAAPGALVPPVILVGAVLAGLEVITAAW